MMGLKCPKNGLLAADSLNNLVEVQKSLGKLNGYKVDLALYNGQSEKVRSLFTKDIQDESLALPSSFDIKNVGEGAYKVELSVLDTYHDKSGAEAKSQCNLTVRRSCAQDEDFDPATVSCVPKLCDNAYRVGAKWTDSLALQRGEGRYECRLEKGKAEKVLLSHTCQGGYFKSKDSCLAAKEIAGSCALLESDEVACWGTVIGKDNYPSRKDINLQTAMKFSEKVKNFGNNCVELESKKIHCWSIVYDENAGYRFMPEESTPKTWSEAQFMELADRADPCNGITFTEDKCEFRLTQSEGVNSIQPAPNGSANCLVDVTGSIWCNKSAMPKSQSLDSSIAAAPYFRVTGLPKSALQVRSQSYTPCAILTDGSVMCWGDNTIGGVGSNMSTTIADKTVQTVDSKGAKLTNITQITSSLDYSGQPTNYALSRDGRVFAWGSNLEDTLANGTPGEDDEGNALFSRFAVPIMVESINPITPTAK
jgi:hypothetical protein